MVDYKFLHDYIGHEIHRLGKIVRDADIQVKTHLNQKDKLEKVTENKHRGWEYGRSLSRIDEKILEIDIKMINLKPKLQKLIEQEAEIAKLCD